MARELLGKVLAVRRDGAWQGGTIIETEAYLGAADPASHSARGPTRRASVMFGPPGVAYVYLVYGLHHCVNAVTEPAGIGAAVLIRALAPTVPVGVAVSPLACAPARLRGPGLVCRELGLTLALNGVSLAGGELAIFDGPGVDDAQVLVGQRVGITRARELPLNFRVAAAGRAPGRAR